MGPNTGPCTIVNMWGIKGILYKVLSLLPHGNLDLSGLFHKPPFKLNRKLAWMTGWLLDLGLEVLNHR